MSTTNNLFPYPGNKARHAEWIVQHIPEHTCYVELFGGAAGVLFNKPKSKVEIYNDLDGDIVHFFEVLRDQPDELQQWLRNVPFSRQLHDEWATAYYEHGERPDDDVERAGRYFYLRYSQWGAAVSEKSGFRTAHHRSSAEMFSRKAEALSEFSQRLKQVTIECDDWREVLRIYDAPHTVFYIDPPYEGTEFRHRSDGFSHSELYDVVVDLEGRCLLSYDSVPQWYGDGFQTVSKDTTFKADSKGGEKEATEYLIMNFDAGGEPLMSGVGQQGLSAFADGGAE